MKIKFPTRLPGNAGSAGLLFLTFLTLYWGGQSPFLDDFDSINFALALENFDLMQAQPHPPGYPVYIGVAKLLRPLMRSDTEVLTFISAFTGAIGVTFFYLLCMQWVSRSLAALASLFLGLIPGWSLDCLKALTDIPALSLSLVVLYIALRWGDSKKLAHWALLGLCVGITAGVRPHLLLIHGVVCLAFMNPAVSNKGIVWVCGLVLGLLSWLLPTIWISGWWYFLDSYWKMGMARWGNPDMSMLGTAPSVKTYFFRILQFLHHFASEGLGYRWEGVIGPANFSALAFLVVAFLIARYPVNTSVSFKYSVLERRVAWALGVYSLFVFFYLSPTNARYLTPWLPFVCLAAIVRTQAHLPRTWALAVWTVLVLLVAPNTALLANILRNTAPAPMQLIEHTKTLEWSADKDVFVAATRYTAYYPVEAQIQISRLTTCTEIKQWVKEGLTIWSDTPKKCSGLRFVEQGTFYRDRRVHYKAFFISLYLAKSVSESMDASSGDCKNR